MRNEKRMDMRVSGYTYRGSDAEKATDAQQRNKILWKSMNEKTMNLHEEESVARPFCLIHFSLSRTCCKIYEFPLSFRNHWQWFECDPSSYVSANIDCFVTNAVEFPKASADRC